MTEEQFKQAEDIRKKIEDVQAVMCNIYKYPPSFLKIYIGCGSNEQMMISNIVGHGGVVAIREAILNYMDAEEKQLKEEFSKL